MYQVMTTLPVLQACHCVSSQHLPPCAICWAWSLLCVLNASGEPDRTLQFSCLDAACQLFPQQVNPAWHAISISHGCYTCKDKCYVCLLLQKLQASLVIFHNLSIQTALNSLGLGKQTLSGTQRASIMVVTCADTKLCALDASGEPGHIPQSSCGQVALACLSLSKQTLHGMQRASIMMLQASLVIFHNLPGQVALTSMSLSKQTLQHTSF